jgi:hypothetical protein
VPLWKQSIAGQQPPWGDGLDDQSLTDLWSVRAWDDVSADELVFLIPALTSYGQQRKYSLECGPYPFARAALVVAIRRAAADLSGHAVHAAWARSASSIFKEIARSGAVLSMDPVEALMLGGAEHERLPERSLFWNWRRRPGIRTTAGSECAFDHLVRELTVLACLDKFVRAAHEKSVSVERKAPISGNATLPDALVASIHSGINAAYVYQRFEFAHELFSVGAWLGIMLRGRPSVIPEFVAGYFSQCAGRYQDISTEKQDICGQILLHYMELALGQRSLHRFMGGCKWRRGVTLSPYKSGLRAGAHGPVWNGDLSRELAGRLSCGATAS